jgi:tetratricopeptide (TPR) repeat protein
MRSAERLPQLLRAGAFALAGAGLCTILGACSSLPSDWVKLPPEAAVPDKKPESAGAPVAPEKAKPDGRRGAADAGVPPAVGPDVFRAFDTAVQALHDGHPDLAERGFLALTKSNPELGGPHANLGIIYRNSDKLPQAITELEQAVQTNPQQPVYWNQLGIVYRLQGQFGKAREAYEKAIALDPSYPAPNLNLGILFDLYLWDGNRALELYDRYLALSPGGDERVTKWVADLKNRNRERSAAAPKEQP